MTDAAVLFRWARVSDFDGRIDDLMSRLPEGERRRAGRFAVDSARHRFVLGRAMLRQMLGAAVGADPRSLAISFGERGKPSLASVETAPEFNLSHSGDIVVLALAPAAVGVDVERLRGVQRAERLARRFFSPAEEAAVRSAGGTERDLTFLRIWTQKEAWLKATGIGVGMPLREVETEPDPTRPPRLIAVSGHRSDAARWSLAGVEIPATVCTIALEGQAIEIDAHSITSLDDL